MLPEGIVPSLLLLQTIGGIEGFRLVGIVFLRLSCRLRIDLLQLADCKWSLLRVLSCEGFVKIRKLRVSVPHLRNDQPHLKAPVPQMDIAQDIVAKIAKGPLDAFPDHCRAQMPDMKRLGHIRSAVVNDNPGRFLCPVHTEIIVLLHLLEIAAQKRRRKAQVDKTRSNGLRF